MLVKLMNDDASQQLSTTYLKKLMLLAEFDDLKLDQGWKIGTEKNGINI